VSDPPADNPAPERRLSASDARVAESSRRMSAALEYLEALAPAAHAPAGLVRGLCLASLQDVRGVLSLARHDETAIGAAGSLARSALKSALYVAWANSPPSAEQRRARAASLAKQAGRVWKRLRKELADGPLLAASARQRLEQLLAGMDVGGSSKEAERPPSARKALRQLGQRHNVAALLVASRLARASLLGRACESSTPAAGAQWLAALSMSWCALRLAVEACFSPDWLAARETAPASSEFNADAWAAHVVRVQRALRAAPTR